MQDGYNGRGHLSDSREIRIVLLPLQELGGARCDALAKHLEVNRAEKAALAARCDELGADVAALQDDLATAERRCDAAEASADAIAQVSHQGFARSCNKGN